MVADALTVVAAYLFLVGQTITVTSFFSFFVKLQSHSDWSTFLTTKTTKTTKAVRPSPDSGN